MRLLQRDNVGGYSLTADLSTDQIPPYAILSHTWGSDEVIFADLEKAPSDWQRKAGFDKIRFCADQAMRHELQYFWVDTCCIDKSDNIELQTAINSMFRWYRDAERCYVYLSDVSSSTPWEQAFRHSRWFSRGWTLQELIAPSIVDFFSKEEVWLGDKASLVTILCEITGIPAGALQGTPLCDFTVTELEAWVLGRQTKHEEDLAYSLLGIFGVHLPLIYGEGRENAQRRLREEVQKARKGAQLSDFSVTFSLSQVPEIQHFIAREKEMGEMRRELRSDGSRHIVVLHGLGGIGKTQLAVEYTKRFRNEYSAIFWLNTNDETLIQQSFVKAASRILQQYPDVRSLNTTDAKSSDKIAEATKAWFSLPGNTRWLMIYDNYDNPKLPGHSTGVDISQFLPTAYQGSIIVTTRSSRVDLGRQIQIKKLDSIDDSLKILSKTSGREILQRDTDAKALIEELDGLPLALATAGAYLKRVSSVSLGRYLCLYKQSWERLHENTPRLGSYADRTLSSTWQLSYDQIQEQNPLAGHLLRWWAYFNNDDLWLELLQREHDDEDAANGLPWFKELYDELNFNNAIGTLQDYGFVEPHMSETSQIESRGYSIHSCLHSWSLYMLNRDIDNRLSTFAIKCIASRVPSENDSEFWLLLRRLLPHAIKSCEAYQGNNRDLSWEFSNLASLYEAQGKLVEAEEMGQLALQEFERAWGSDHMSTLDMINNLGKVYEAQGRLKKAEAMYKRALEGYEKAWGLGHESILTTINNLGNVYNAQGRLKEAEAMYKRALEGKKKAYGSHHMSTLKTINNLGIVYEAQGRLKEAEAMYKRALEGYEKAWGSHHTSTLSTINNLGGLCETQGRLKEAEAMYKRALDGYEKACGSDHMSTLNMINNIGIVYTAQGRLNEAEAIYKRALEGKEKACGSHNPSTLDTINNLGILYEAQGRLKEAEAMHQRALEGKEKTWGSHHTSTLDTINNLGVVYTAQGRLKEAEAMYKRALQGYENAHGSDSMDTVPSVLNVLLNLGAFYNNLQNKREARLYYDRAQCGLLEVYGPVDERYLEVSAIIESLSAYEWPLQSMNWKHTLSGAGKLWLYTMGAFQARRE